MRFHDVHGVVHLSQSQIDALLTLFSGWRWGIDTGTAEALYRRGLAVKGHVRLLNGRSLQLPRLTDRGYFIAAELREEAILSADNVLPLWGEARR